MHCSRGSSATSGRFTLPLRVTMPTEHIMPSLAPERIGQVCRIGGSMARTLVASLCCLSLSQLTSAQSPAPDPFERVSFLVGRW